MFSSTPRGTWIEFKDTKGRTTTCADRFPATRLSRSTWNDALRSYRSGRWLNEASVVKVPWHRRRGTEPGLDVKGIMISPVVRGLNLDDMRIKNRNQE
jgi:hypothetical protein